MLIHRDRELEEQLKKDISREIELITKYEKVIKGTDDKIINFNRLIMDLDTNGTEKYIFIEPEDYEEELMIIANFYNTTPKNIFNILIFRLLFPVSGTIDKFYANTFFEKSIKPQLKIIDLQMQRIFKDFEDRLSKEIIMMETD